MFRPQFRSEFWHRIAPYMLAVVAVTIALAVRLSIDPWLHDRQPFMTFMAAVIFTAWFGGVGPSLMALVAGLLLASWFFLPPRHDLFVVGGIHHVAMLTYTLLGLTIVALGGRLGQMQRRARRSEELQTVQSQEIDSERKRLQRELERLTTALRDVDRRRENFLALLADELRRPLLPIASAASFHSIAATAAEMEAAMNIVKQETTHLGHLIDDLLDSFESNQGRGALAHQPLDLVDVVSRAVAALRSLAAQSGRELNVSLSKNPVSVDGDASRLIRLAYNLIMNAIRSTSPGGQIWVTVVAQNGNAVLKVKDSGVGLAPEGIERVFQLNSQLDGNFSRDGGGLNIRLLAVKPIVAMHAGHVTIHSEGLGQGCEFVVTLPCIAAPDNSSPSHADRASLDVRKASENPAG